MFTNFNFSELYNVFWTRKRLKDNKQQHCFSLLERQASSHLWWCCYILLDWFLILCQSAIHNLQRWAWVLFASINLLCSFCNLEMCTFRTTLKLVKSVHKLVGNRQHNKLFFVRWEPLKLKEKVHCITCDRTSTLSAVIFGTAHHPKCLKRPILKQVKNLYHFWHYMLVNLHSHNPLFQLTRNTLSTRAIKIIVATFFINVETI